MKSRQLKKDLTIDFEGYRYYVETYSRDIATRVGPCKVNVEESELCVNPGGMTRLCATTQFGKENFYLSRYRMPLVGITWVQGHRLETYRHSGMYFLGREGGDSLEFDDFAELNKCVERMEQCWIEAENNSL